MKKAIAITGLVISCTLAAGAEILEQILVKVNGEILTKTELEERQVAALRQRNRGVTAKDLRDDAELKKALDEITPQLIVDTVDEILLMQRGRDLGVKMTDEQFASIVQNIRKENKLDDEETFQAALKQEGLTLADLRKSLERQLIISRVQQQEVWNRVSITEGESKAYYEAHRNEFTTPSTVTLREILVEVVEAKPKAGEANAGPMINVGLEEEAKEKIDALRGRAVGGEDFARLAATESDAASRANGGLIGPISEEELAPALRQLLAKMKPGEVTQPLRVQRGFQIIKLESRTETETLSFEEARDQISDKVFQQKRRGELLRYLSRLRTQAIIEWKNEEIRKAYEAQLAKETAAPSAP